MLREIDERFGVLGPMDRGLEDNRSWSHSKHKILQMLRQRVYQIYAGYEDCNDADLLRIDPVLRLTIGKADGAVAGQSRLSRLENKVLCPEAELRSLEDALMRSNDALMRRKKKLRLSKVGSKVAYHGRRRQVHVASAFPLARHYRAVFG